MTQTPKRVTKPRFASAKLLSAKATADENLVLSLFGRMGDRETWPLFQAVALHRKLVTGANAKHPHVQSTARRWFCERVAPLLLDRGQIDPRRVRQLNEVIEALKHLDRHGPVLRVHVAFQRLAESLDPTFNPLKPSALPPRPRISWTKFKEKFGLLIGREIDESRLREIRDKLGIRFPADRD
jgi:hypothetical protein